MNLQQLNSPPLALQQLIRGSDTHKGLYGSVAIIGGARNMTGATLLAGRAALHLGAGKVFLGILSNRLLVDPVQPELMIGKAKLLLANKLPSHILIGPGLGQTHQSERLILKCLKSAIPLIIDADGLNVIARKEYLQYLLQQREAETLITPHPTEASRLLQCTTSDIQHDRQQAIIQLHHKFKCGVILKGNETLVIGQQHSVIFQNKTGNSALSSAGQGDVLGGIILALWAQGLSAIDASCCGVYIHGSAADLWRKKKPLWYWSHCK